MAVVRPFAAARPRADLAAQISAPPYDVVSTDEARKLAAGNPLSFLHVSKPEIDLTPGHDPRAPAAYAVGARNFMRLFEIGALMRDPEPRFYLYRQQVADHAQVGIVATVSCADYINGVVKRHELTHEDVVADRTRHIEALNAQTGPAFLFYRARPALDALVENQIQTPPEIDFVADDGVRHSTWTISDGAIIKLIETEFASVPALYIADGHHRTAAAAAVHRNRGGTGPSSVFLAVLFPHNRVRILPYNRVVKDATGWHGSELLRKLESVFDIAPAEVPTPKKKRQVCIYLAGRWYLAEFKPGLDSGGGPVERMDVVLLQRYVLEPVFGIAGQGATDRIRYVGGARGTAELERLVDSGEYSCAFSMFPPSVEDLMTVADLGRTMPPKSTWFEPKLRDGLFCHLIE
ncbi:MAG: DUF1015 family protein [Verrucomicrobiae bacterium]|nr:DUF1015 family protein [Verrucomicrobiae bacterium]